VKAPLRHSDFSREASVAPEEASAVTLLSDSERRTMSDAAASDRPVAGHRAGAAGVKQHFGAG